MRPPRGLLASGARAQPSHGTGATPAVGGQAAGLTALVGPWMPVVAAAAEAAVIAALVLAAR